ncbi:MAG: DUF4824 family protein [Chloroflexi bacterium]|nr:DUF4824 family protein [Chloroflexota bacterium]
MKRALVLAAAAAVVLASNAWVLMSAKRNQADARGGAVELTERELGLPPMIGDSTAILLELKWDAYSSAPEDEKSPQWLRSPEWLNVAKLTELGFDCRMPVTSPEARDHYSSLSSALVCLVLEYEGKVWKSARPDRRSRTRLFAVDAGRDARRLREKHTDTARYIITQGVVRLFFQERDFRDKTLLSQPRLRGQIEMVLPNQIFVPQPYNKVLQSLRGRRDRPQEQADKEPRFAVTISWGANYEPWVQGVRLLPATDAGAKDR